MSPKILVGVVVVVLAGVGVVAYTFLFRGDVEEASVSNALEGLASESEAADPADGPDPADGAGAATDDAVPATEEPAGLADATGEWIVSTEIGTFDFSDASSTFVGFRVDEELRTGPTEAIGRTQGVSGSLTIEGTTLTAATIEADFTAMESNVPQRDNAMKRAMHVDTNPTGTFVLGEPVDFGQIPAPGETASFEATGELTVNGITQSATFALEASVDDGNIIVAGSSPVAFADFGIEAPTLGPVVSVEQEGIIEVQVWFVPA